MNGKLPSFVGVTVISVRSPGTASCFCRNSGTQNEWMTSREVRLIRTCRRSGSTRLDDVLQRLEIEARSGLMQVQPSTLALVPGGGYATSQVNCWPRISICIAFEGSLSFFASAT